MDGQGFNHGQDKAQAARERLSLLSHCLHIDFKMI